MFGILSTVHPLAKCETISIHAFLPSPAKTEARDGRSSANQPTQQPTRMKIKQPGKRADSPVGPSGRRILASLAISLLLAFGSSLYASAALWALTGAEVAHYPTIS